MIERIIIAGAGGQGIMLMGKVLAEAAMLEGKQVTWFPCYGAEVRGGTAHCMVIISDAKIGSPYIRVPDSLIAMNLPSLERFKGSLRKNGILILNSSLAGEPLKNSRSVLQYPFTGIAAQLGNAKAANMVALGCYLGARSAVAKESVLKVFEKFGLSVGRNIVELNTKALNRGLSLGEKWSG